MTLVIVGHPVAGYSGYQRAAGRGFYFSQGETELVDLTAAQQTALTSTGYTVDGLPDPPTPDPFPQYLTPEDAAAAATSGAGPFGVALRAASVTAVKESGDVMIGRVVGQDGQLLAGKGLFARATTDGADIDDLFIGDVA